MGSICLPDGVMAEIRAQVIEALNSYEADSLPIVVRFILQSGLHLVNVHCDTVWGVFYIFFLSVTPASVGEVVRCIRTQMDFDSLCTEGQSETATAAAAAAVAAASAAAVTDNGKVGVKVTLEAILSGLRFQAWCIWC